MSRKNKLEPASETATAMIGLVTTHRDFRLVHFLNQTLEISMTNTADIPVYDAKTESLNYFPFFSYHHTDLRTDFCLIANHNAGKVLIPSLRQINFFLLLQGAAFKQQIDAMIASIRKIQGVQAAIPVNQSAIKEVNPLMEDLELHKIELLKQEEGRKDKLFLNNEE